MAAGRINASYPLSYADAIAAGTARELKATLVTGGPEFEAVEKASLIKILWLPTAK